MNSGSKYAAGAVLAVIVALQGAVAGDADVLRFLQAPRYAAGTRYVRSASVFDVDGTLRRVPQNSRSGAAGVRGAFRYPWKWYRLGTDVELKRISHTSDDIGSRSYIGLGDLHGYVSIQDGPAVSGTRLTIPTGLYRHGMGTGAFALAPFAGYTFKKKLLVAGEVTYALPDPDDVRRGVSLGVHAAYRWRVVPQASFRYAWPDDDPWTSVEDSPSMLLTLGAEGRWRMTEKLAVYGRVAVDAWGRDAAQAVAVECGIYRR